MEHNLVFQDYFRVVKPTEKDVSDWQKTRETFSDSTTLKKGLKVTLEASHAGLLNKNNRVYIPARMEAGIPTWVKDREKPAKILKHHKTDEDPVGVIREASYVSTVPDDLKGDKDIAVMLNPKATLEDQVDAINSLMKKGVFTRKDWRGLGYTKLVADIYDEDTIEKVLDGRLDGVSTSFRPKTALCTVCKQDVTKSLFGCGHVPGRTYVPGDEDGEDAKKDKDKVFCMWIPDEHNNLECSFVTFDADPITSVVIEGDSEVEVPEDLKTIDPEDSLQEYEMSFSDSAEVSTEPEPEADGEPDKDAKLTTEQRKNLSAGTFCGPNKSYPVPDKSHAVNALARAKQHASPALYSKIKSCICKKFSGLPSCKGKSDSADPENWEQELLDELKNTIRHPMTGEDVSLGDYIFEPVEREESDNAFVLPSCADLALFEEDLLKELYSLAEAEMLSRKLIETPECEKCKEHEQKIADLEKDKEDSINAFDDQTKTVEALRKEIKFYIVDYERQVDEYVKLGSELEGLRIEYLATLDVLLNKHQTLDEAKEALKEADLEESRVLLTKEFDLEKARAKLNDGMSREPKDSVADPVLEENDTNEQLPSDLSHAGKAAVKTIRTFVEAKQTAQAYGLFDKMKNIGVFSKDIKFDDLVVVKETTDNN